ncbi:MAG: hypothetical protein HFG65_00605 [Hungatella sp.]|nr:hypothetical protein [Hungatella sp.]
MDGLKLGLDLCDGYTKLSCLGQDKLWAFPTVVCRKKEEDVWLIGEDAYASALMGDGVIVDKLLKLVKKDGTSTISGIKYRGVEILVRFLERVLMLPLEEMTGDEKSRGPGAWVEQLVITVSEVEARLLDCLMYCGDYLQIPRDRLHVISHTEGFLYYVLNQKREMWNNQVGMFDLSEEGLFYYEMKVQRGMRNVTVVAEKEKLDEGFSLDVLNAPSGMKLADKILCACGERFLQKKLFSSVFLAGKGFENQDWAPEFMKLVCARRRVFVEPALFAQGAALRAMDLTSGKTSYPYVMICDGRLDTTVCVNVFHQDKENQLVLAAAGDSWYESKSTVDFILDNQNYLEFSIIPLGSKNTKTVKMVLEGFPQRDDKTVRVQTQVGFLDEKTMAVVVKDMGFGEFFPSTGAVLRQEVMI